jgi:hypothetical protein
MKALAAVSEEGKINDLFMALIGYAASMVGPGLAQGIDIPAFKIEKHTVYPSVFAIQDSCVTVGAKLESRLASSIEQEVEAFLATFWTEVDRDAEAAGGIDHLLLTPRSRRAVAALGPESTIAEIEAAIEILPRDKVLSNLARTRVHVEHFASRVEVLRSDFERGASRRSAGKSKAKATDGIGVAISEHLFDSIVSKYGNVVKQGSTSRVSLAVIRGWLAYRLALGAPDIAISKSRSITGAIPIDVWAGLIYQLRTLKGDWGRQRRLGLGVKGKPKLSVKTKESSGLSLLFDFDLGGLDLYTGFGFPIDDIIRALDDLLFIAIEAVLDLFAIAMSFVVIPVEISIAGQETKLAFSKFSTDVYSHPKAPAGPRNNFLSIEADVAAK